MTATAEPSADARSLTPRLSIVVPAFNEEDGIVATLKKLRKSVPGAEIIVVDDGSYDRTAERAARVPQVHLIRHEFNQGYGAAIKSGMRAATREFVAWFDADDEHRIEDLLEMAARLEQERKVAVIGRRSGAHQSVLRGVGKAAIKLLALSLGAHFGQDINCGLRIFRRSVVIRYLGLLPDRFSASMTSTMVMIERGYPIAFHDITVNARIGTSKVKLADGFEALALVLRMVLLFAPLRIFLGLGSMFIALGGAYSLVIGLAMGLGLPVGGLLVTIAGLLLCMLGLVADQISQLRLNQLPTIVTQHSLSASTDPESPSNE